MRKIVLEGVEEVRPLYFSPYTLAGRGYSHHQDAGRSGYERRTDRVYELGADMKYNLTSNLTCVRIVVAWSGRGCWVRSSRRRA